MSWRFLRSATWIVRHVLVVMLVATMIGLGLWQLQRHDDKRAYKELVEVRQDQPAAEVRTVVPEDADPADPEVAKILYRSVRASGTYVDEDTVVVENRTYNAAPGAWVLTPLRLTTGTAVVVNRGFIGFDREGEIVAPPAPSGTVTVEGLVVPSQRRGRFGPVDPAGERLSVLARVDLERLATQLDYPILPAYVQVEASQPPEPTAPAGEPQLVALGPPELSEGPHLSYAAQWAIFTIIAAGGYVLLLRRVARDRAREAGAVG